MFWTGASMESRLQEVESRLEAAGISTRLPVVRKLTFRGRPVVGSQGIFAEFGMAATKAFTEAVADDGGVLVRPASAMGPIPNRDQNQLLITSTAVGSFGFELQERRTIFFLARNQLSDRCSRLPRNCWRARPAATMT